MNFSYNGDKTKVAFAGQADINASYKDLSMVCESIRYKSIPYALKVLNGVIKDNTPIKYSRYNKGMGARHELGGKKGRYPVKCAKIVKDILSSAVSNAINKGFDETKLVVIHASSNKNQIIMRTPPKGNISWGRGMYGYSATRRSDLEFSKVELGVANPEDIELSPKAKDLIKLFSKQAKRLVPEESKFPTKKKKDNKAKESVKKENETKEEAITKEKEAEKPKEAEFNKEIDNLKHSQNIKDNVKPIKNVNSGNDRY